MTDPSFPFNPNNPYLEEVMQHKHKLERSEKYESMLESKKLIIELERKEKEKYMKGYESLKVEIEIMMKQREGEAERWGEIQQAEILKYKGEIAQLRTVIKGMGEGIRGDKQLRRENERMVKVIQEYLDEFKQRDQEITRLKDTNEKYWQELNQIKRENRDEISKDSQSKEEKMRLELENQSLLHRVKLLKQQLNEEIEVRERKTNKLDEVSREISDIKEEYEGRIGEIQGRNKELEQREIQLEKELALAMKDIEYLKREVETGKEKEPRSEPNQKRNIKMGKRQRGQEEDPECTSIERQEPSKIPRRQRQRERIEPKQRGNKGSMDHHCTCLKSQKYKGKLKQANDKIVQLLADKCRRGIEASFQTKTSKRYVNTTFDI